MCGGGGQRTARPFGPHATQTGTPHAPLVFASHTHTRRTPLQSICPPSVPPSHTHARRTPLQSLRLTHALHAPSVPPCHTHTQHRTPLPSLRHTHTARPFSPSAHPFSPSVTQTDTLHAPTVPPPPFHTTILGGPLREKGIIIADHHRGSSSRIVSECAEGLRGLGDDPQTTRRRHGDDSEMTRR